mgnify:FL=1
MASYAVIGTEQPLAVQALALLFVGFTALIAAGFSPSLATWIGWDLVAGLGIGFLVQRLWEEGGGGKLMSVLFFVLNTLCLLLFSIDLILHLD